MGNKSTRPVRSAWVGSIAAHTLLLGLSFLGYRSLRSSEAERLAGLIDTKLSEDRDYGEVELRCDDPPRPKVAPPAPKQVVETPVVQAPKLEAVETFPAKEIASVPVAPVANQATSNESGITPPAAVTPNSGKGTPLHPSVGAGKSIVYVLDCSASMGREGKLKEACAALMASLEQLSSEVKFQIVLYESFAEKMSIAGSTELIFATLDNKRAVQEQLDKLVAQGTSKHVEGLKQALLFKPSAIFLLTDADDLTEANLIAVGQYNCSQTVIYPILFGQKDRLMRSPLLERLATANRGRVITRRVE